MGWRWAATVSMSAPESTSTRETVPPPPHSPWRRFEIQFLGSDDPPKILGPPDTMTDLSVDSEWGCPLCAVSQGYGSFLTSQIS